MIQSGKETIYFLNEIINELNLKKEDYELRIFIRQQKELNLWRIE